MPADFEFRVIGGELVPDDPQGWSWTLMNLEGKRVTIPRPKVRRDTISAKQRRYYRKVIIPHIVSFCVAGEESEDYYHEAMLEQHGPRVEGPLGPIALRTSNDDLGMNTQQAEEYFHRIREWAANFWREESHRGYIPLPNEYDPAALPPEPSDASTPPSEP